ncbi:hypothetical protein BCR39DRAFT_532516 [Naematelia encephala]|uniref:MI domain-containing protein n=1 Tax=Naematelia encephala TaxID=71784 RepID=A0A1Y2B4G2_9TREE|nr:hypothetical protein BCR39DRAFT_532516 [Naematelia encephala]
MGPFQRGRGGSRGGGRGGNRGGFRGGSVRGPGGPQLPSTLMAEVDAAYGLSKGRGRGHMTRKDQRKAARHDKHGPATRPPKRSYVQEDDHPSDEASAHAESSGLPKFVLSEKAKGKRPAVEEEPPKKKKKKEITLPGQGEEDAEAGEIEWLEYMLKKEAQKGADDVLNDGLDDLLDFADIIGPGGQGLNGKDLEPDDSDGATQLDEDELDDASSEDPSEEEDASTGEGSEAESDPEEEDTEEHFGDDDDADSAGEDGEGLQENTETTKIPSPNGDVRAEQTGGPSSSTAYVPPHLRAAELADKAKGDKVKEQDRIRLERRAQGLLNKLSEANLESILGEIEGLYRDHSRNDVTTTLTALVITMVSSRANLLDSFVVLYATLVGALHRVIGMEFGAHFIQTLVMRYQSLVDDPSAPTTDIQDTIYESADPSKESLNLLTLISELYNAGVVSSKLIYDLIRGFLTTEAGDGAVMSEQAVEGLLRIIKCCGQQLRSDDPASLKDIVGLLQDKTKGREKAMTTRARFMVETLVNLRSGKSRGSVEGTEAANRMKKFLSGLGRKRRLRASDSLRVGLTDLLDADKKGKWWLVGAGWSGDPLNELQETTHSTSVSEKTKKRKKDEDEALLDLARKQGMNTDVRRSVFLVITTSEDYVHACDRLAALRLTEVQQRECVRVTLHCASLEQRYNPYYTLILQHLCAGSYDHRFTLQYALWDFLREIEGGDKEVRRRGANIARALAYVVARGGLDMTAFKAVEWTSLSSHTKRFLQTFLAHLIVSTQTTSPIFAIPKTYKFPKDADAEVLIEVIQKSMTVAGLAEGWLFLLQSVGDGRLEKIVDDLGGVARELVGWGVEVVRRTLQG